MGLEINKDQYIKIVEMCNTKPHKIRENKFGVSWCTRCGRLFSNISSPKLEEKEKLIIKL